MAATPILAIPYPVGTDRVMDGDNAMQAIAERVEALLEQRPRGPVAFRTVSADYVPGSGSFVVPGLSFGFTTLANHRYRLTAVSHARCTSTGIFYICETFMDATTVQTATAQQYVSNAVSTLTPWADLAPTAGAHTFGLRLTCQSGQISVSASAAQPCILELEDLGTTVPASREPLELPELLPQPPAPNLPQPKES